MRICRNYCENCGIEYSWLASGFYDGDKSNFGTHKFCKGCSDIDKSYESLKSQDLNKIPKISIITNIETSEIDIETLLKWERQYVTEQRAKYPFYMTRIYATLARDLGDNKWETDRRGEVIGKEGEFKGRIYFYIYWPSEKENATILVKVRKSVETDEIINYITDYSQLV